MAKANILIVEDSFIVTYHLQTTLESEGYTIVGKCDSGEEAIKFAAATPPDLVLMDIMLTGKIDGIEAATVMRKQFNVPVIYITALTDKETISRAKLSEPFGYLTKPFEDREIFTVIEMALYKHDIELKLKQSEEKYFSTVNSIGDAVVAIDRNYCISFMNSAAIAMTQWTLKDALGKSIMEVLRLRNETTLECGVNPVQCPLGFGNINRMPEDLVLSGKHGLEVPIGESSLSPMLNNHGNFMGLIIVFKDMTEKRAHLKLLQEMDRQRIAALIEGQEKERARIAKDLHDGLGQMLNAIKMNLDVIKLSGENVENLSDQLDEAIQESVRISENLLPAKLRDFDLATCLRSLCKQTGKLFGTKITFDSDEASTEMQQSQKVNLYRIAQEALNNAIKHAHATNISLQLTERGDTLRLSIEDDGGGIAPHSETSSLNQNGLVNMRDRAEMMEGKLTIETDEKRGTLVVAEVPLHKSTTNA